MALNYTSYIKTSELLALQQPLSSPPEHDETLFIVIHQVYELWFKQIIHELELIHARLCAGDMSAASWTLKRVRNILKTLVGQMDILETMTPLSFNSFRSRLETASGFQSVQFREIEFILGYRRTELLGIYAHDQAGTAVLKKRLAEPSIVDAFYILLERLGFKLPAELRPRDLALSNTENTQVQDFILQRFRENLDFRALAELLTDVDEGFQEWRYRHIKMVERAIGFKAGTGGSYGVPFLQNTLFKSFFPDLWAIRSRV